MTASVYSESRENFNPEQLTNLRTLFFTEQVFTVTASVYSESRENFNPEQLTNQGRCSSCIEKILAGEMNSSLKTCTTLVVSIFEQICCFSKVTANFTETFI